MGKVQVLPLINLLSRWPNSKGVRLQSVRSKANILTYILVLDEPAASYNACLSITLLPGASHSEKYVGDKEYIERGIA